eukprot:CAMPEP_0171059208 /NCGR_PEP_ID=MMETSP0766_2-20121228/3051_1 /TAXON_ID=439317 /ORGANISM="Gambierdiscus australes, Strain CAWD 149" /LENGTH=595 /DNA_ID=CAMNT_0011514631 /DNA_START=41 /DNA_END=1828 /DNA_ORIENTATION=-
MAASTWFLTFSLLKLAHAGCEVQAECVVEDTVLLQHMRRKAVDSSALAGKSMYFLLVDRFGRSDGNLKACADNEEENNVWCGGTISGAIEHLDYIKGMGFDCVWITPVVKQYPGTTASGTGAMGYWAQDLYKIDPHYGTPEDYKRLISELHSRDMCIVQDFVANHMGPIHSSKDTEPMNPFNKPEHFHQLFVGNRSFDEYTKELEVGFSPAQAMWSQSGAQCTQGMDCHCYVCDAEVDPFGGRCAGKMVFNPNGPCKEGAKSDFCKPGDYNCDGYNETITQEGWFYDLGDLNQSHPFVRQQQLKWISWFVKEYDIDVLRLDTAAFMSFDFLSELQKAAGVPIIGEVTATNLTYHAQFEANPPPSGRQVLAGVLNFPIYFSMIAAFCNTWFPFSQGNLTFLGERMADQSSSGVYANLDTLGNFPDNHDVERITKVCGSDHSKVVNTVVWTMLSKGAPIIYYGTEVFTTWQRESFWTYGYDQTTFMYRYLAKLNTVRKDFDLSLADMEVVPTTQASTLVFKRGAVMVYLNNLGETEESVRYCGPGVVPPAAEEGKAWANVLSEELSLDGHFEDSGCYVAKGSLPKILVQVEPVPVEQ